MISIPEAFAKVVIQIHGEQGRDWLKSLDGKIATAKDRWHVEILHPPFDLSYNYVVPVVFKDQSEAVLKLCVPGKECLHEIHALKFYSGPGMCRLIDCDPDQGILLLERLTPGNRLTSIKDESRSMAIAVSLVKSMMRRKRSYVYSFPAISDQAVGIQNLRRRFPAGTGPFKEDIVRKVELLFSELISSQTNTYLLHGDFHHENILQSEENWKLIDPKGVLGEMEYELIPFLINNLSESNVGEVIDARVSLFNRELGIRVERTYAWGLCHSLLSAWWNIEDNLGLSRNDLSILKHFDSKVR